MKQELEQKLLEKYPRVFGRGKYRSQGSRTPYVYPCVDDGWYDIVDTVCALIEHRHQELERSNTLLVNENELDDYPEDDNIEWQPVIQAAQIKEKFGGLRFYTTSTNDYVRGVIDAAEALSLRTCETCGAPGKPRNDGWIKTLCDVHAKAEGKK
jgi:hypothetical protein